MSGILPTESLDSEFQSWRELQAPWPNYEVQVSELDLLSGLDRAGMAYTSAHGDYGSTLVPAEDTSHHNRGHNKLINYCNQVLAVYI